MTPKETFIEMLCRWDEAIDRAYELGQTNDQSGCADGTMPGTWNDSYRRLEEILRELRQGAYRREHNHLVARYRDAPIVRMRVKVAYGRLTPPAYVDVVAGQHGKGDKTAEVLVRDARHVVSEQRNHGRYRMTHPDPEVVKRGLQLVEIRWFAVSKQPPFLPKSFLAQPLKVAA